MQSYGRSMSHRSRGVDQLPGPAPEIDEVTLKWTKKAIYHYSFIFPPDLKTKVTLVMIPSSGTGIDLCGNGGWSS